jgi:hypothetical protein
VTTTLTKITDRPSTAVQLGTVATLGGSPTDVATALADSSDLTYVQINTRCRLDSQVVRLGFPVVTLPAGARVYSVEIRRRVLAVTPGNPVPVCLTWHRCATGSVSVAGQQQQDRRKLLVTPCPTTTDPVGAYVDESLGEDRVGPDGAAWDPATNNLSSYNASTNPGGYTYDLGREDDEATTLRISAVYRDIYYQRQSTIAATGPTGSSSDTRPTVTWTYASLDSQPQRSYRVAVYSQAQYSGPGFVPFETVPLMASGALAPAKADSWWVLGEDLRWSLPGDLTDGAYRAYVQATSRWSGSGGDFTTPIASTTWTRAGAPASPPPAAVLSSAVFDAGLGRVTLTFAPGGSSPATTAFNVESSVDNGVTWTVDPSLRYIPANGLSPVVRDHRFYRLNVAIKYRVIAFSQTVLVAAAAPSNEVTMTPTGERHRLVSATNPLLDTTLPIEAPKGGEGLKVTLRQMMATYQLIGGAGREVLPKVVWGPTYGREYELTSFFAGDDLVELYPALDEIVKSGSELWFQHPDGTAEWVALGPGALGRDTEETYDAVPGNPRKVAWRRRRYSASQVEAPAYF